MDPRITNFLDRHRNSVLSVLLPDGEVHGATCHFAHIEKPFQIVIVTKPDTRKCLGLKEGKSAKAAVVVGFSEEEWVELQLSGDVKIVTGQEELLGKQVFEEKYGGEVKPDHVVLAFSPSWSRFTEFKRPDGIKLENGKK